MSDRGGKTNGRLLQKLGNQTRSHLQGGDEQTCRTTTITQAHLLRFNDGRYNSAQMIDCKGLWMHYCVIHYQHLHKTSVVSQDVQPGLHLPWGDTKLKRSCRRSRYCTMGLKSPRQENPGGRRKGQNTAAAGPTVGPKATVPPHATQLISATARWFSCRIFFPLY